MDFYAVLDQVVALLRRHGRVSYRALKRQFALDDELLADLTSELRYAHYTDRYQNAVFPHRDRNGICGFEFRNYRFRGFSKGGEKGLWYSRALPVDTTLIVCESGIDVLSYHVLHQPPQAHYFSIAGEMNPMQKILLASAMQKLPRGGTVIAATDNDPGGVNLARKIREIAEEAARQDLGVVDHRPDTEGQDWNDVQRALARSQSPAPHRPGQPANLGPT
jgi:hypothetical protein